MPTAPQFREDLIARYDKPGPRYASYPPATEFHDSIGEADYRAWVRQSNEELIPKPLSLYLHIPYCSSLCSHCAGDDIVTRGKPKAEPYLADLRREIELQGPLFDRDREVRQLHWGGGTPGFLTRQQGQELMRVTARNFRLGAPERSEFSIEVDPRLMQKGDVKYLHDLGFSRLGAGLQDFGPREQTAADRRRRFEATAAVFEEARLCNLRSVNLDLIYGLPRQTVESFDAMLEAAIELDPDRIAVYNCAHLPQHFAVQRPSAAKDLPDLQRQLEILRLAIDRLCAAGYESIGMDHFARPGKEVAISRGNGGLQRNFQGYAAYAQSDSIGLGVSAISQVNDNFSQNYPDPVEYHNALEQGRLPIARGYQSDEDDLLRRDVIQHLVCNFRLDTSRISRHWEIDFEDYFADEIERLGEMQQDGMLEIDGGEIRVLDPGRLLVQNIGMVFDRYQRHEGERSSPTV